MPIVRKTNLDTFDINNYLTIKQLSHDASSNIGEYFPCFSYFAILQNMSNSENTSNITLGTVQ